MKVPLRKFMIHVLILTKSLISQGLHLTFHCNKFGPIIFRDFFLFCQFGLERYLWENENIDPVGMRGEFSTHSKDFRQMYVLSMTWKSSIMKRMIENNSVIKSIQLLCWNVYFLRPFLRQSKSLLIFYMRSKSNLWGLLFFFVNIKKWKYWLLIIIKIIQWTIYVTVKALSTFLKNLGLKTSSSKFFIGDWKSSLLIRYRLQFRWKFVCNFHFVKKCAFTKDINREINVPWKKKFLRWVFANPCELSSRHLFANSNDFPWKIHRCQEMKVQLTRNVVKIELFSSGIPFRPSSVVRFCENQSWLQWGLWQWRHGFLLRFLC